MYIERIKPTGRKIYQTIRFEFNTRKIYVRYYPKNYFSHGGPQFLRLIVCIGKDVLLTYHGTR